MPRPRLTLPVYQKHKQTGRAAVSFYREDGTRTEVILPGDYGSKQSKEEYERLLCKLRANDGRLSAKKETDITISELIGRFMDERVVPYYVDPVTKEPTLKRFHASVTIDPLRLGRDASQIAEGIVQHLTRVLAAQVEITLEFQAELPEGASEKLVRDVAENCRTPRFNNYGFEEA